jgi:hypothetical protein
MIRVTEATRTRRIMAIIMTTEMATETGIAMGTGTAMEIATATVMASRRR